MLSVHEMDLVEKAKILPATVCVVVARNVCIVRRWSDSGNTSDHIYSVLWHHVL